MLKYLVPQIALAELSAMFGVAFVGAVLAGGYGIVHDEITYTISPEYFTKLKFAQFHYADSGLGERFFVATIGFLATSWVGFAAGWFLARWLIPNQPRTRAYRQIGQGFGCILAFGVSFAALGYGYGLWRGPEGDYSRWAQTLQLLRIADNWSFVRVAYIHNAGYLGGTVGLVVALLANRPQRPASAAAV
jgi:hypothetical protein